MYTTNFDFELSNEIEFHSIKSTGDFAIVKASKIRLFAPSFKHREYCGKIKDISEREGAVENGTANYCDTTILDMYNAFYSLFKNPELMKGLVDNAECDVDSDFLDKILDFDIQKIITKYIQVFFHPSTQEKS